MLPTQYLEFRDSPSSPGSQWYAWHLGRDSSSAHARPLAFLPPLRTLNASHGVKQKCLQGFPNSLLGWEVRSHLQKKMFQQPLFIMSPPHPCSMFCSRETEHNHHCRASTGWRCMHLAPCGHLSSSSVMTLLSQP